jgi:hypothetical protein
VAQASPPGKEPNQKSMAASGQKKTGCFRIRLAMKGW